MAELRIVAVVEAKAAYQKEIEKAFQAVVNETRKEAGNVSYDLHQDVKDPLKYTFFEIWKSQAAIDEHNESAHFKTFVAAIEGKIEKLTINVVKKIY